MPESKPEALPADPKAPESFYWLDSPAGSGWVGVDSVGHIQEAALNLHGLLGKRLAHLSVEWGMVKLQEPIPYKSTT